MVCDVGFCAVPITTSKQLVAATDPNNDALDAISGAEIWPRWRPLKRLGSSHESDPTACRLQPEPEPALSASYIDYCILRKRLAAMDQFTGSGQGRSGPTVLPSTPVDPTPRPMKAATKECTLTVGTGAHRENLPDETAARRRRRATTPRSSALPSIFCRQLCELRQKSSHSETPGRVAQSHPSISRRCATYYR